MAMLKMWRETGGAIRSMLEMRRQTATTKKLKAIHRSTARANAHGLSDGLLSILKALWTLWTRRKNISSKTAPFYQRYSDLVYLLSVRSSLFIVSKPLRLRVKLFRVFASSRETYRVCASEWPPTRTCASRHSRLWESATRY
jgi:hypothetical protein